MPEYASDIRPEYPTPDGSGLRLRLAAIDKMVIEVDSHVDSLVARISPILRPLPETAEPDPSSLVPARPAEASSGLTEEAEATLRALRRLAHRIVALAGAVDL